MARSTYEDFLIKDKIGSGSYGVVFKVIRKVDRLVYAMKEIDLQGMSRKEQEECIREVRVLSSLECDYIIKYYDSFLERGKLYIITEYAANGNLHDYIKHQKQRLPEDLIWKLFIQILLGLNHMHSKKILHRDIKTLNVFLDDKLNVKLGDMGVAKILSTNTNFAKTIVGTPYYLSPELCEDKPYNEKSDVWALGVVLYECCTQRHPFDADNQGALILKILRGKYPAVQGYSPDVADIIKRCLTQNANRRPNTYKMLTLQTLRSKGEELGVVMPDQASMAAFAERTFVKPRPPLSSEGSMEQPPRAATPPKDNNDDKAFVFGSTMPKAKPSGDAAARPKAWGGGEAGVDAAAAKLGEVDLDDDDASDEDRANIYDNPQRGYAEGSGDEDDEDGADEGYDNGDEAEGEGGEEGGEWAAPNPTRVQHMRSALMIQRAACMDLVGEKAFNELYALLKSNQVDEASMTDLSRLVFQIIPYDKSEVIQMMYRLLYLESQLEGQ